MPAGWGRGSPPSPTAGAWASATSRGSEGRGSSGRSAPGDLDDVGGRRDVVQVELADPGDVIEHGRELAGHRLDLLLAERQARQTSDVQYLLAPDHSGAFYGAPAAPRRPAASAAARAALLPGLGYCPGGAWAGGSAGGGIGGPPIPSAAGAPLAGAGSALAGWEPSPLMAAPACSRTPDSEVPSACIAS